MAARRIVTQNADERLAWLIVIATIPVGITGLALEHTFRTLFAKPLAAAIFLTINGFILLAGERLRKNAPVDELDEEALAPAQDGRRHAAAEPVRRPSRRLTTLSYREAGLISFFQTFALLAGISRSGISMVGAWRAACPTATPLGSPSFWRLRSSSPPACSSCRRWPDPPARTSTASCSVRPSPASRPTSPSSG